ncbi:MAG TPA: hypothetical protein PKE53_16745 [Flavobacteriales bacterium]|nr:hypothetical protein [Flavobacteriales bacterium]HNA32990.1 hypothetical protein [Flavobacteriales bacterium]HNK67952.1 hypothetical protein [Flavobacteriales bacterium]
MHDFYFYNVHSGSELDMFFLYKGKRVGVEIKRQDAPRMTKSIPLPSTHDRSRPVYGSR